MARVELNDSWLAVGDVQTVHAKVRAFCKRQGMKIIGDQSGVVYAKQGSPLLARLLSTFLSRPTLLPKRATVKIKKEANGVTISAGIEETSPAKELSPTTKEGYEAYFGGWMKQLKSQTV